MTNMIQGNFVFPGPLEIKCRASCMGPFSAHIFSDVSHVSRVSSTNCQERVKSALAPLVQLPKEANFKLPD